MNVNLLNILMRKNILMRLRKREGLGVIVTFRTQMKVTLTLNLNLQPVTMRTFLVVLRTEMRT